MNVPAGGVQRTVMHAIETPGEHGDEVVLDDSWFDLPRPELPPSTPPPPDPIGDPDLDDPWFH